MTDDDRDIPPWPDASLVVARSGYGFAESEVAEGVPEALGDGDGFDIGAEERYEREGVVGHGGMGRISLVYDKRLRRRVALKEALGSAGATERLTREAWITSQLEHPSIVPVYGAGRDAQGALYYTMRLVRGRTMAAAIEDASGLSGRLELMRHVLDACEAVAYAHSLGVVHRDLKPANIMVGEFGETQVLDWGLARPTGASPDADAEPATSVSSPELTAIGAVVGTPSYMSPEQFRGEPAGPTSDVWSLGALVYAVLTGDAPYRGPSSDAIFEARSVGPPAPIASAAPAAPAELVAIADKAMAPNLSDRYTDAKAMAADILAWQDGRRVAAYEYSSWTLLRRLVRIWRVPLAVGAAGLLLAAIAAGIGWQATDAERRRALDARERAEAASAEAQMNLSLALSVQARSAAGRLERPEAEVLAAHALQRGASPDARGVLARYAFEPTPAVVGSSAEPRCASLVPTADAAAFLCLWPESVEMWNAEPPVRLWAADISATDAAFFGDGFVGVASKDAHLHVFDVTSGSALGSSIMTTGPFELHGQQGSPWLLKPDTSRLEFIDSSSLIAWTSPVCPVGTVIAEALVAKGDSILVVCSDSAVYRLQAKPDAVAERMTTLPPTFRGIGAAAIDASGRRLAVGGISGSTWVLDIESGQKTAECTLDFGAIQAVDFSPDGEVVAVSCAEGRVVTFLAETGQLSTVLPGDTGWLPRFRKGSTLRLITAGPEVRTWELTGEPAAARSESDSGVSSVAIDPSGRWLAATFGEGLVEVREMRTGQVLFRDRWQEKVAKYSAFSRNSRYLFASASGQSGLRVIDTQTWEFLPARGFGQTYGRMRRVGVLEGDLVWGLSYGRGGVRLWRSPSGERVPLVASRDQLYIEGATDHLGLRAVLLTGEGHIELLEAKPTPGLRTLTIDAEAVAVDVFPDGDRVAIATLTDVRVVDAHTGAPIAEWPVPTDRIVDIAVSPDGQRVATGALEGVSHVFTARGQLLATLRGHSSRVSAVEFDSTGASLVTGSWDGATQRWGMSALLVPGDEWVRRVNERWGVDLDALLSESATLR